MAGPLRDPGPQSRDRIRSMAAGADAGGGSSAGTPPDAAAADVPAPGEVEPLPDAPVDAIDEWTLDQLHRRASEVDLEGRWEMTREELVEALRETP